LIRAWICLVMALGIVACAPRPESSTVETSETISSADWREIDSPVGVYSFAPGLVEVGGELVLSWLEQTTTPEGEAHHQLLVSRLGTGGWSKPSWVAAGSDFFANWADTPAVAASVDGTLFSHWLAKTDEETYAYSIFMARSDDGGESWQQMGPLNDDDTPTEHGFVSFVAEGDGVRAFWLDGRQMVAGGDMTFRTAWVGQDPGPAEVLDDRVCECCSTSAAVTDLGPIAVVRNRSAEEIRDIGIVRRVADGWTATAPVAVDDWRIEGCPVNGPVVAATGRDVAVAWYTAGGSGPKVQIAFSTDAGESFRAPHVVDSGRPMGRVDLVWDDAGEAIVSWLEGGDDKAEIRLRRFSTDGVGGEPVVVARTSPSRASGFPRLERVGEDLYLAWVDIEGEEASRIRILEIPITALG
jgi:hypothetical protein